MVKAQTRDKERFMNALKKLWIVLDNKKSAIAAGYWTACAYLIPIWVPNGLTGTVKKVEITIGTLLTLAGLGHKLIKAIPGPEQPK